MIKHVRELAEQLFKNVSLLYLLHLWSWDSNIENSHFWDWSSIWKWKWLLVVVIICIMTKDFGTLNVKNFVHVKEVQYTNINLPINCYLAFLFLSVYSHNVYKLLFSLMQPIHAKYISFLASQQFSIWKLYIQFGIIYTFGRSFLLCRPSVHGLCAQWALLHFLTACFLDSWGFLEYHFRFHSCLPIMPLCYMVLL